jgi:hypothetical protein
MPDFSKPMKSFDKHFERELGVGFFCCEELQLITNFAQK